MVWSHFQFDFRWFFNINLKYQELKIALAWSPGLPFLTAGLPSFVTRKFRQTNAYKINWWNDAIPTKIEIPHDTYSYHYNNNNSKLFPAMVRCFNCWNNSSRPRDINIDKLGLIVINSVWFTILRSPTAPVLYISVK